MREMIPNVLLIDDSCNLHNLLKIGRNKYQAVVCLFWASPETKRLMSEGFGGICYCLDDLIKDIGFLEMEVAEFVQRVCDEGPKYKGIPLRRYLSEELFRASVYPKVFVSVLNFLETLRRDLGKECLEIDSVISEQHSNILNQLDPTKQLNTCLHFRPHPKTQALSQKSPLQMSLTQRLEMQLQGATITGQWRAQVWNLIEKLDKDYKKRGLLNYLQKPNTILSRPITFFSSYLNNSRILQPFEPLMSYPVDWVVTNYYARRPISNRTKLVNWIWSFGSPQTQDSRFKDTTILDDLKNHSNGDGILEAFLLNSRTVLNWTNGHLTSVTNLTSYWENYLDKVRPRLIVMANQWGIEGLFGQIAMKRGIPVMQIMHGVMGGHFYTKTPVISDIMLVPGEFWRNLWPEDERHKILVFNAQGLISRVKKDQTRPKKVLTYFSWPLFKSPFYSSSELTDGFIEMFHRLLLQETCEISVRCHPLENPYDFVKRWKQLYGPLPMSLRVEKHEPLDRVLERTDVALMFRSTVMLNCMLAGIPVIVPGWIDFGWNQTLKKVTGIYLARGFADLEGCLEEWLKEPPGLSGRSAEYFIRSPGEGEDSFRSVVERLATEPQKKREDLPRILSTTI